MSDSNSLASLVFKKAVGTTPGTGYLAHTSCHATRVGLGGRCGMGELSGFSVQEGYP